MRRIVAAALLSSAIVPVLAEEGAGIPFPDGYRQWHHHRSTVNLKGHAPESNVGVQHVYANAAALDGLRSGTFADGATFVVDATFRRPDLDADGIVVDIGLASQASTIRGRHTVVLGFDARRVRGFANETAIAAKDVCTVARAIENMAYVISANTGGIHGTPLPCDSTNGGSKIVFPPSMVFAQFAVRKYASSGLSGIAAMRL